VVVCWLAESRTLFGLQFALTRLLREYGSCEEGFLVKCGIVECRMRKVKCRKPLRNSG